MSKIPFNAYDFFGYLSSGFLILFAIDYLFNNGQQTNNSLPVAHIFFWILIAYIIGHLISHISSFLLGEKLLRGLLGSAEVHLFKDKTESHWAKIFPGYFKPLPSDTRERISALANEQNINVGGRGFYYYCHPRVRRDQFTLDRLNIFLNIYSFCRSICMALLILTITFLVSFVFDWMILDNVNLSKLFLAVIAFVGAVGLFYRYLNFFRHYTVEVFTSWAELCRIEK